MRTPLKKTELYQGFEQGPIRPPSEAYSLLIRVTRNCPWNRCTFCPVYKESPFSIRPMDHVKQDIDSVSRYVEMIRETADESGRLCRTGARKAVENGQQLDQKAFNAALHWVNGGMKSVFIQDANSLLIKPPDLVEILKHLRDRFPWVERVTSYARSHTIARIKDEDLEALRSAGLNRMHIGMESGSDVVLKMRKKGVTKETHIRAGLKVKKAGMELSEYIMPGLGGAGHSELNALETADALNRINPEFIRLRTLAIPNSVALFGDWQNGRFQKCTDLMMVKEIRQLIASLDNITSILKSDHILNLLQEVEGTFPDDKERMLATLGTFLEMAPERRCVYQVGRRIGVFTRLSDMQNPHRLARAEKTCRELGITQENVDGVIDEIMKRFI